MLEATLTSPVTKAKSANPRVGDPTRIAKVDRQWFLLGLLHLIN
jgi:hypothetical protein